MLSSYIYYACWILFIWTRLWKTRLARIDIFRNWNFFDDLLINKIKYTYKTRIESSRVKLSSFFDSRICSESPNINLRYWFELLSSGLFKDLSLNFKMKTYFTRTSYWWSSKIRCKDIDNILTRSSPYYILSFFDYMNSDNNHCNIHDLRKFFLAKELMTYLRKTVSSRIKINFFNRHNYFLVYLHWSLSRTYDFYKFSRLSITLYMIYLIITTRNRNTRHISTRMIW